MEILLQNGVACVRTDTEILTNVQDALDLMATVKYDTGATRFCVPKCAVSPDFFVLRTGLAGEILQKFVNYRCKFAVYGDFSAESAASKPLHGFIYESNNGNAVFFAESEAGAVAKLAATV